MAQYDVHRNTEPDSAREFPDIVEVQSDLLRFLDTRLVVPLGRPSEGFPPMGRLTPRIDFDGEDLVFLVNHAVSIPRMRLGPVVGALEERRAELLGAIDFLLTGV